MRIGNLIVVSASAVGLGIFLGAVPLSNGQTAADLLADWLDGGGREGVRQAKRVAFKTSAPGGEPSEVSAKSAGSRGAPGPASPSSSGAGPAGTSAVSAAPAQPSGGAAPITAGAANSPEQTSASDKAALDQLIFKKTK